MSMCDNVETMELWCCQACGMKAFDMSGELKLFCPPSDEFLRVIVLPPMRFSVLLGGALDVPVEV